MIAVVLWFNVKGAATWSAAPLLGLYWCVVGLVIAIAASGIAKRVGESLTRELELSPPVQAEDGRAVEIVTLYERDDAVIAGIEKLRFFPLEVASGRGSTLVDPDGRDLLDLSATWTASGLGHGHPAVVEAVSRAVRTMPGSGGLSAVHPDSVGLAEDLLALVPGSGERRVYLGHAGSDANDVALRACRHASGSQTVLAFEHSYHGGLGVAMGVSGVHVDAGVPADPMRYFCPTPILFGRSATMSRPTSRPVSTSPRRIWRAVPSRV